MDLIIQERRDFLCCKGKAHPDLFDEPSFDEFSRPCVYLVLEAARKG
ncbi:hypothetical protein [Cytobacillus praedii]|nr:hypothetical protein [Cytobacillus praedii]MED3551626.1 hypothetical protein [Cytobacillus praedii]